MKKQTKELNKPLISPEHKKYIQSVKRRKILILVAQISILVFVIGLWELLAQVGAIDVFDMSCPSRMMKTIGTLAKSGELGIHIGTTLWECLLGFAIATVLGILIAILLWWSETLRKILEPYIIVLNSLPKIALGPIIILWVGAGTASIVLMAVLIAIIITIISALNSFISCDEDKIRLLKSMGANKFQILIKLILPRSIPDIIAIIKVNVGMSWVGTIMGEYLISKAGLGYLIVYGGTVFKIDLVMAATFILCVLAAGMYFIVAFIEKFVVKQKN